MLSTATYDINGRVVSSVNVRDSITTTISYDDSKSGTGQPGTVATTGQPTQFLWYDSAGNRTHQDEVPNFTSRNLMKWGYDALRRVVSEKMTLDRAPNGTLQPTPVSRSWTYAGPATTYVNRNGWTVTTTHKPSTGTRTETAYEPPATG